MNKVWKWVRRDGLLHIETCALIAVVVGLSVPWWIAGLVAVTAGLGKEVSDLKNDGVASWHDVICDLIGVILGTIIVLI